MSTTLPQTYDLTSRISRPTAPCVCGTYAEVNRCNLKDSGNKHKPVAVKSYKSKFDAPLQENSKKIRSEIQLLLNLPQHVNVVPFLGFKNDRASLSLVTPWMSAGTLTSFIGTQGATLKTADKMMLLHDISSGLEHLHSQFVVHGNLESDNVLITERHVACLSGFRQSVRLSSRDAACPPSQMPPKPAIQFAGPEWFVGDDPRFLPLPNSLFKSDIYSLGCLMFYIFTRCMPWQDVTSVDISDQLQTCVTPSRPKGPTPNDDQWALMKPCLSPLPRDRPTTSEVLFSIGPLDLTGQIEKGQNYVVASGGYGSVYISTWNRKTGDPIEVAVKVIHTKDLRIEELKKHLKRELAAWKRLSHPNIASLLGTTTGFGLVQGMVSLWMKNGSLHAYLDKSDVPPIRRLRLVKDIAEGLKYLHKHPIVHGDLTPWNVLIDDDERAVLTDFGLSIILGGFTSVSVTYSNRRTGAPAWAAPELFPSSTSEGIQPPSPSTTSDVYSFACLMYRIFTGSHLWNIQGNHAGMTIAHRVKKGNRPSKPGTIDTKYWSLIEQCWAQEPSSRPDISDVLPRL